MTLAGSAWSQTPNAGAPNPASQAPAPPAPATSAPAANSQPPAESPLVAQLKDQVNTQQMALSEQDARLKALEEHLAAMQADEARRKREEAERRRREARRAGAVAPKPWYDAVRVSGYIQAQYESHQDSEDQLAQGGQPLNQDRFLVRRARLIVGSESRFTAFNLEIDGNTTQGPAFGLQRAEATALWRGTGKSIEQPPLVALTVGMFLTPFGYEVPASPRERWFMERSLESQGFFPSEPDVGARLAGQLGFFDYAVAVVNGEPKGARTGFPLRDPNAAKDVLGRLGVHAHVSEAVEAAGGVSVLDGKGFFSGTDNTKSTVSWIDSNENGSVQQSELGSSPGGTGLPSKNFKHWAVGADARVGMESSFGRTQLSAEVVIASNLDRGVFIADPVSAHFDIREFGINATITQDVLRHGIVGFRYDYYDPQGDVFGLRNGELIPVSEAVTTYSPLVGLRLPAKSRLVVQYDIIRDHMAIDKVGVPVDRKNNTLTIRLQGQI